MTNKHKIEDIEQSIAVDKITIEKFGRSFQIYPWLKGRLFHKEVTGKETLQRKTLGVYFKQFLSVFYGCWNIFGSYDVWSFTNSAERRLIDGKYFDRQFDYSGNQTGVKMLVIELRLFNYYRYSSIASKRAISKSFFILFEEVYGRLLLLRAPKIKNQEVLDALNREFEAGINEKEVVRKYLSQYKLMKFWLHLLPNPKEVFMTVGYTNFGYIRAFKEKGIKVIEMQHGLISKNHHAYYYRCKMDAIQFPDEILSVGEKEIAVFDEENLFPVTKVTPVGSYIIDHYRTLDKHELWQGLPKVIVALQDGAYGDQMAEFLVKLLPLIEGHVELVIQPRRTSKEYYTTKYPELNQVTFGERDFYQELINCDAHATIYSTTAIESLSLGRPNILINIQNLSEYHLHDKIGGNPFTKTINRPDEFLEALEALKGSQKDEIMESNSTNIKVGFKDNIRNYHCA